MRVVQERCCGLDIHKRRIVGCVLTPQQREVRTFGTTTRELWALVAWLEEHQCRVVAMEATGVFWKPVYNVLEAAGLEPLVVNAQHIKATTAEYPDRQHGFSGCHRGSHRSGPSTLWPEPALA